MEENDSPQSGTSSELQATTLATSNAEIMAHQAADRAFSATETGGLFRRFATAHGKAWTSDCVEHISDRRLKEVWAASDAANDLLVASIKKLQSDRADLLEALKALLALKNYRPNRETMAATQAARAAIAKAEGNDGKPSEPKSSEI